MGKLTSGKKSRKKARKIGLLELTFYVFSRILNLQIHAHIYRSFICHHKMLGVRIAKRQIEPQKPANPCGARLCSCIFFVNTLQKPSQTYRLRRFFLYGQQYREHLRGENHPAMTYFSPLKVYPAPFVLRRCRRNGFRHPMYFAKYASTSFI